MIKTIKHIISLFAITSVLALSFIGCSTPNNSKPGTDSTENVTPDPNPETKPDTKPKPDPVPEAPKYKVIGTELQPCSFAELKTAIEKDLTKEYTIHITKDNINDFATNKLSFYENAGRIKSVVFDEGITKIPDNLFANTDAAQENLGTLSFTDVYLPSTLTTVGEASFNTCMALKNINFPESLTTIGNAAFAMSGITSLKLTEKITSIGIAAFSGSKITEVTIPSTITSIQQQLFENCTELTKVVFPDTLTEIKRKAFNHCSKLAEIIIPAKVTSLGDGEGTTFSDTAIKSIVIPEGVEGLYYYVLGNCPNLTSVTIPSTVNTIAAQAFQNSPNLKAITFNNTVEKWKSFEKACADLNSDAPNISLPEGCVITCTDGTITKGVNGEITA